MIPLRVPFDPLEAGNRSRIDRDPSRVIGAAHVSLCKS
jgi:hypothetical protein